MNPSTLLFAGIISAVIGIFGAVINVAAFGSGRRGMSSAFVIHGICALFYIGGAISALTGIVMFLINYAKS